MSIHRILLRNWWVIAFVMMAGALYFQAIDKKNRLVATLQEKVDTLSQAKYEAQMKREELLLRVASQDDPDFIELVLKEKLGVAAEGELKVVFP